MFGIRAAVNRVVTVGFFAIAAGWLALAGQAAPVAAPQEEAQKKAAAGDRAADQEAVKKALDTFTAAFQKGDGKVVAALFTAEGEYVGDDGTTNRGRAALEKDYAEFFAKNP